MKFNFVKNKKMENLYDYFLHYNIYTEEWNAILRNETNQYMGGVKDVVIFTDKDINKLIEKISSLELIESV
jgi:hypothetical protein